ncbi:MAG: ABC transporter ATP-binding protein [Desulfobulbaceae bacterium]|nr:ABC transporter ATP-binding protein [Desulfobulbaceae bacterium]
MITIRNLQKRYGETVALKGIDLEVNRGELFAYLGPNGAGKSTTICILTGLTRMSGGSAELAGFDVESDAMQAKLQFGVVHQYVNLDQELTVFENLDLHGQLFSMRKKQRREKIAVLLDYVEMTDRAETLVKNLSGGLKRRVTIARALLHEPAILFLDEPTVGLDAAIRRRIWALVKKIQQQGTTIFLTTHHIEEAEFLAQRVAFLDEGRIVALDTPERLMREVGSWAIDQLAGSEMTTTYFKNRQEADRFQATEAFTLRRVNLEDAFLSLTGKKVLPC